MFIHHFKSICILLRNRLLQDVYSYHPFSHIITPNCLTPLEELLFSNFTHRLRFHQCANIKANHVFLSIEAHIVEELLKAFFWNKLFTFHNFFILIPHEINPAIKGGWRFLLAWCGTSACLGLSLKTWIVEVLILSCVYIPNLKLRQKSYHLFFASKSAVKPMLSPKSKKSDN